MDRMKRIIVLTVSILTVAILASASSWEGSAMMGAYGDFPSGGYFAACNSFPRNTAVEVTNLETGKTVTVIIVRGLDNPGVFMMVSAEAAEALGLRQGRIARVRAVEPRSVSSLAPSAGSRKSLDSDFNPRLLAAEELKRMGYELEDAPVQPVARPEDTPVVPGTITEAPGTIAEAPEAKPEVPEPAPVVPPAAIAPLEDGPQLVQDLIRPEPAVPESEPVAVPGPEAPPLAVDDKPEAINGGKPKPVRTVVLPELPEPAAPLAMAELDPLDDTDTNPEIFAMNLPVPDETPLRVSPALVPRRFEAPAALPDVLDKPRAAQLAPEVVELSLAEPESHGPETVVTVPLEVPLVGSTDPVLALTEPETKAETDSVSSGRMEAHEFLAPVRRDEPAYTALVWPELEADEIPDIVLARLSEPAQLVPATSLAEGEVIFPLTESPAAVALETPSFAAAETRIALAAPEVEPLDQAEILAPKTPGALDVDLDVGLAEADIASEAPGGETPGEVIVVLEPTDLRPPVVDAPVVVEAPVPVEPPVVKAPDPVVVAPEPVKPEPVKPEPAAVPVRPAMATGSLERGRHYIQVGAYRTEAAAVETVSVLRMDYVIVVETPAGSSSRIWKIFVGPMGRDESGLALLRVRSLGFKDAFLKVGG